MSINNLTRKITKNVTNRRIYHILADIDEDPYPEIYGEYIPKGFRNSRNDWYKRKRLFPHEVRQYKTWKHNRKHQYKDVKMQV